MEDLIPSGAAAAFADVLTPTGAAETHSRIRQALAAEQAAARSTEEDERATLAAQDAPEELRGQLRSPEALRRYVLGGKGTLTLVSRRTGQRFTFKLGLPKRNENGRIYVRVLTGPENTADYEWLGTLWTEPSRWRGRSYPPRFSHSARSRIGEDAPSARAAAWLFDRIARGDASDVAALLGQADVWHEGRCGACGRKLTVPESIESGIGPVCAERGA